MRKVEDNCRRKNVVARAKRECEVEASTGDVC